ASQDMIEVAAARFQREGLAIPLRRCLWTDLPAAIDERFDVVLCTGNALVHATGRDAMVEALIARRRVARGGRRCVVLYVWEIPDKLEEEHTAHIVFLHEEGDRIEPHEYPVSFHPFT